ncbi:MAG: hypothetical protein E7520_02700 [Ruminococcaceae bacterium]|nr:hypothetical protein [Oscillospiraceae bacterium]
MKQSKQVALAGMFAALQIVLMFLGSVVWILCYTAPMLCGLIMIMLRDSVGTKYCFTVYLVCSLVGIFFLPDKECVLTYVFFFGYYTMIRDKIEALPRVVATVLKYLLFNVTIAASQVILVYAFHIPFDTDFGKWSIPLFAFSFNFVFFFYEKLFPRLVKLYEVKYKSRVDRLLK